MKKYRSSVESLHFPIVSLAGREFRISSPESLEIIFIGRRNVLDLIQNHPCDSLGAGRSSKRTLVAIEALVEFLDVS